LSNVSPEGIFLVGPRFAFAAKTLTDEDLDRIDSLVYFICYLLASRYRADFYSAGVMAHSLTI
jgi:hypothetical protein